MPIKIYKILNKINQKIYIGQARNSVNLRWRQHCWSAERKDGFVLHRAIRKYGIEAFRVSTLCEAQTKIEADNWERHFIAQFNSRDSRFGYNRTKGGDGTWGYIHTPQTRRLIAQLKTGLKASQETRLKMQKSQPKLALAGLIFSRLQVLEMHGRTQRGRVLWLCRCACGKTIVARGDQLKSGNTRSCGCLHRETVRELLTNHNPRKKGLSQ